ncbi:hypothetical protein JMJ77_0013797, partial [Colletotrichum scovillei]
LKLCLILHSARHFLFSKCRRFSQLGTLPSGVVSRILRSLRAHFSR